LQFWALHGRGGLDGGGGIAEADAALAVNPQMTSSSNFGKRFVPLGDIKEFFSRYSSAPASISFSRFFPVRLLRTTTGIATVVASLSNSLSTSCPLILGKIVSKGGSIGLLRPSDLEKADSPSSAQNTS
jgi:hypothetical protein